VSTPRTAGPSAEAQLLFLQRIQRLLQESDYTTTYKFALLKVLCDLSIELPDGEHTLHLDVIADRFIEIYWGQSRRFRGIELSFGGSPRKPAKAITLAKQWRAACNDRFWKLQQSDRILVARREMRQLIRRDVIWRLQPAQGAPFIYRHGKDRDRIILVPGAVAAMRSLHTLLSDLIESHWTRWVQRRNPDADTEESLREHLFGVDRRQLRRIVPDLLELQEGRSFYSARRLDAKRVHVDHFIPWSLSRHDAIGNLVLCTPDENVRFSDSLKPASLRDAWSNRNLSLAAELEALARRTGLRWDPGATNAIADWAYRAAG
jgi:hypothetical protein